MRYFHDMEKELLIAGLIGAGLIYWGPKDLRSAAVVFTTIVIIVFTALLLRNSRR